MSDLEGVTGFFLAKGRAAARFEPGGERGEDCRTCQRKVYSYPDTCDAGWERLRAALSAPCLNWTDRGDGLSPRDLAKGSR